MMADNTRVTITKLNNDNYQVWKYKVELLLIKEDLWNVVSQEPPTEVDAAWTRKDGQARATIGLLVEDNQFVHIRDKTTARDTWNALKTYHQKATLTSKVYLLKRICSLKLTDDGSMEDHINNMLDLVNKLAALGEQLMDHLIVAMMLSSLPDSYNTLITALESRAEEDLTLDLVKGKLIDEYKRRKAIGTLGESNESALKTSKESKEKSRGNQECFFCKKHGHQKKDCYKYKKWKQNKEKANQAAENPRKDGSKSGEVCFHVDTKGKILNTWFIDSGATSHMTSNKDFFEELDLTKKIDIRLADGESREACGIGMGKLKCLNNKNQIIEVKVTDVLYVPSLEGSLLSVKRLTEKGLQVKFESNKCCITKDGKIVAVADESSNLYKLRVSQQACVAIRKHNKHCQHMWHKRFGHRDPEAVKQLANNGLAVELKITDCGIRTTCKACIKGKMARKSFPKKSESKTSSTLDLIHTDLCGPMQTQTPGKKRYILTIIDDYSRYTEVFLLRSKDETAGYIKDYIQKVKTQFNKKPKFIRSDRGKEYINAELKTFLKQEGIQVQYTAAYSPQQNGVAERKNRSLMEMARCMIIDAEMPNKYWGEAIVTATYLQNRLPTKATERTPYELWFTTKPNVNQLRIFGCTAFAHIPKEQRRKLDVKAKELRFVGYAEDSKAFRLLDITTDKIIISRDVIFIEDIEDGLAIIEDENEIEVGLHKTPSEEIKEESTVKEPASNEEFIEKPKEKIQDKNVDALRRSDRKNKGVPPRRYEETAKIAMELQDPVGLQEAKISSYPMDPGYENIENSEDAKEDSTKYQKLIGELLYVAVHSRPDIAATVSILSQRIKSAKDLDWTEAKRTVRYLKGTIEWKLKLGDDTKEDGESLFGYADANWAQNKADRKSNSGFIFMLNGGTISWACRKQTCVALSTTEAEYIALAEACQEGIWIRRLLEEFGITSTTPLKIYEDNQSCLKLLRAKGFNNRTKHIDTKYHFVKQLKESNVMDFVYCQTSDMIADMLTKPLHGIRLKKLAELSGLKDWSK